MGWTGELDASDAWAECLHGWEDAAALVLSCPGPLRRHHAASLRISQLKLPQCLLGSEAQLYAFAAALPRRLAARCQFAPLPEMFASSRDVLPAGRIEHVRFGSVRTARVLKGAGNSAVVAEVFQPPPLATSGHPFASGRHLPAAMQRMFCYAPLQAPPCLVDDAPVPAVVLPAACLDADLKGSRRKPSAAGLDLVSFASFSSGAWAEGPVSGGVAGREGLGGAGARVLLLPWNLDNPGSIVPEILVRLARLQSPRAPRVKILVMPFNYLGQTGIIRRLIKLVSEAAGDAAVLDHLALGRLTHLAGLPLLRSIGTIAWIESGDPEHGWSLARLAAAGFSPVVLPCGEERIWVEAQTRYGTLAFHAAVPSLRELRALIEGVGVA